MMSCLHHPHAMQTMMTWCSYNANTNDVIPPHFYMDEWNMNAGDVMVTWFAYDVNLVMSRWACAS